MIDNIKGLQQKGTKILFDANILRFEITRRRFSLKEFLPIMQYHRYGFINRKGNIVIEPIYDDFKGELSRKTSVCVKKKDKWGIIASNGEVVADFEYDFIFPSIVDYTNYQENCAYFEQLYTACRNHQWGILKNDGNIFVEFGKYDWIDGYDSGLARVKQKEKWGIIVCEDHELAQHDKVTAAMLAKQKLFSTSRMTVQNEVIHWLSNGLKHIDFPVTYNFNTTVLPLIRKNLGAVVTIEGAYRAENHEHLVFIPFEPELKTGIVIVWKKDTVMSNVLKKFITLIESISKEY